MILCKHCGKVDTFTLIATQRMKTYFTENGKPVKTVEFTPPAYKEEAKCPKCGRIVKFVKTE